MASAFYNEAKEAMLSGTLNLTTAGANVIKAALVDTGTYTFAATHDNYTTHIDPHNVGTDITLGSKTVTNGTFDAADNTWTSVTGNSAEAIVIYDSTNDILVAYIDGITVTPNGNDIDVTWDAAGIFSI